MEFPNGWMTIGAQVLLVAASGVMHVALTRNNPPGQNTILYAFVTTILGLVVSATTFYTLTGSFPWQLVAIGLPLAIVGFGVVAMIFLAAGLLNDSRAGDVFVLQGLFFRKRYLWMTVAFVYLALVLQFVLVFIAFQKAQAVNVNTSDGLFEVGFWTLSIPTAAMFLITNVMRGVSLISRETPRQVRIHALAFAFSQFIMTAWSASYPWYAFRQQEIAAQPVLVLIGFAVVVAVFFVFVIIPFVVGRMRFDVKKTSDLGTLKMECARLEIATDATISQRYASELLAKSFNKLQQLIRENADDRPVLSEFHQRFTKLVEGLDETEKQTPEQPGVPDLAQPGQQQPQAQQEDTGPAERADPRLFVFISANKLVSAGRDLPTLRGAAYETSLECDRWLALKDGQTGLLALLGFAGSAVIPLGARVFESEFKGWIDGFLALVGLG